MLFSVISEQSYWRKWLGLAWNSVLFMALLLAWVKPAGAEDLKIGLSADVTSMDPHFVNIAPNIAFGWHVFDALTHTDKNARLIPGLALSWKTIDATTWEFKLRPGVKFHDGSEFSADDVAFSVARPATLSNSPGPFTSYTKSIIATQIIDKLTIRFKTATPYGMLPADLNSIMIVSKKVAEHATSEDFNSGKAMIGTGPFKFERFERGQSISVIRNPNYWGGAPRIEPNGLAPWDRVIFRILPNDAARTAALLAGDVDVIENPSTPDIARLKSQSSLQLAQVVSWRTLFWQLDQYRDVSPFISDKSGKALDKNPFKDRRVRLALSKAISRDALVSRVMEGLALPASNIVSPHIFGHSGAAPEAYDPEGAKKLLIEAGYPDGFALTLHAPNNRYVNDDQIAQATAQMLSKIGIACKVETMPSATYFGRARKGEFSMALLGWGSFTGDFALRAILGSPNPETGYGTWNWGQYKNPKLDELIAKALANPDDKQREGLAKQAASLAMNDVAVIPSHHQLAIWAMKKGLRFDARTDEFTLAHQISK